jgi:hypothetical protein
MAIKEIKQVEAVKEETGRVRCRFVYLYHIDPPVTDFNGTPVVVSSLSDLSPKALARLTDEEKNGITAGTLGAEEQYFTRKAGEAAAAFYDTVKVDHPYAEQHWVDQKRAEYAGSGKEMNPTPIV